MCSPECKHYTIQDLSFTLTDLNLDPLSQLENDLNETLPQAYFVHVRAVTGRIHGKYALQLNVYYMYSSVSE